MKKSFLSLFLSLMMSVTFIGCNNDDDDNNPFTGGGGGGGSANTYSKGVAAGGNGTIFLNGSEFSTEGSTITINNSSGSSSDLKAGQVVALRGTANGDTGTASAITSANDMTGSVDSVSGTGASTTITVLGQTIRIDGNTLFEPAGMNMASIATGTVVEVSGLPDGNGALVATLIESKPTASVYNIRGRVSDFSDNTFTLSPNDNGTPLTVTMTSAGTGGLDTGGTGTGGLDTGGTGTGGLDTGGTGTTGAGGTGSVSDGQYVNVIIDPATYSAGSTSVTAQSVTVENPLMPNEGDVVFLEGFATNPTGTGGSTLHVAGIPVDASSLLSGSEPSAGDRVVVKGRFENGVVMAEQIQPGGGSEFIMGAITSVSAAAAGNGDSTIVVSGSTIDVSSAKIMMNGMQAALTDLLPGKQVIVKTLVNHFQDVSTGGTGTGGLDTGGTGTDGLDTGGTGTDGLDTGGTGTDGLDTGGTGTDVSTGGTGTTGTGAGGTGSTLKAMAVWIIDNMHGPISEMTGTIASGQSGTGGLQTASTATITVFGQSIVVDGSTQFGPNINSMFSAGTGTVEPLTIGSILDASGVPDGDGNLLATYIESLATGTEYHVRGVVSGATGSPVSTFSLTPVPGGTPLTVSLVGDVMAPVFGFTDGATVDVKIDPVSYNGGTSVTAKAVNLVNEPMPTENDQVIMMGTINNMSGSTFTMNGMDVNAGTVPMDGMMNGSSVMVTGTVGPDGRITANQVQMMP